MKSILSTVALSLCLTGTYASAQDTAADFAVRTPYTMEVNAQLVRIINDPNVLKTINTAVTNDLGQTLETTQVALENPFIATDWVMTVYSNESATPALTRTMPTFTGCIQDASANLEALKTLNEKSNVLATCTAIY
jgi:hypothetical protein